MDQADQLPELTPAPEPKSGFPALLATLLAIVAVLGLGVGLTAYGLYQLSSRRSKADSKSRTQKTGSGRTQPRPAARPKPAQIATPAQRKEIARLIDQLGSAHYTERSAAHQRLLQIGPPARDQLEAARDHEDQEVRWRVISILEKIKR